MCQRSMLKQLLSALASLSVLHLVFTFTCVSIDPSGTAIYVPGDDVHFQCLSQCDEEFSSVRWLANESSIEDLEFLNVEGFLFGKLLAIRNIPERLNMTNIRCIATLNPGGNMERSPPTLLLLRGLPSNVTNLNLRANSTHVTITWIPPTSLDEAGIFDDNLTYCVNVSSEGSFCGISEAEFVYPLPVSWCHNITFTVAAVNLAGRGPSSVTVYVLQVNDTKCATNISLTTAPQYEEEEVTVEDMPSQGVTTADIFKTSTSTQVTTAGAVTTDYDQFLISVVISVVVVVVVVMVVALVVIWLRYKAYKRNYCLPSSSKGIFPPQPGLPMIVPPRTPNNITRRNIPPQPFAPQRAMEEGIAGENSLSTEPQPFLCRSADLSSAACNNDECVPSHPTSFSTDNAAPVYNTSKPTDDSFKYVYQRPSSMPSKELPT